MTKRGVKTSLFVDLTINISDMKSFQDILLLIIFTTQKIFLRVLSWL